MSPRLPEVFLVRYVLLTCLLLCAVQAEAKYEYLLHRSYADRYEDIDTTFFRLRDSGYDSISYFRETDLLAQLAKDNDDPELYLEARWLHAAYYRSGKQRNPESLLAAAEELLPDAIRAGNKQITLRTYLLIALYYFELKKMYAPALFNYLRAYNILRDLPVSEFPNKKEPLTLIGTAYYNFGDYLTARTFLKEAEATPMVLRPGSQKGFVFIRLYNALGLVYRQTGMIDSAVYFFNRALNYATTQGNTNWVRILHSDIATCYIWQGRYDEALALIDKGVRRYLTEDDYHDEVYNYSATVAYARLMKKDYTGALPYLQECRRIVALSGKDLFYERLYLLYRDLSVYAAGVGKLSAANRYADSAFVAGDSARTGQKMMALAHVQEQMQLERFGEDLEKVEAIRKLQFVWTNALLITIALLCIIVILFINRHRLKHKQKSVLAEKELHNAEMQLQDFTRSIHEKNDLIEKITAEIERYQSLPCSNELPGASGMLTELQQSILLTDDQWEQFKTSFDKVYPGFLQRLRQKLPDLTPAETRFMTLSKMNLSNKEMAGMLGISLQGVRNYRYRLRKKLQLPEEGDIDDLVMNI